MSVEIAAVLQPTCPHCKGPIAETDGLLWHACATRPDWWTTDDWATPLDLFNSLSAKHGPFDLDAAARPETAKVSFFYTKEDNGLELPWCGVVWVNPPYSHPRPWCEKALEEITNGNATRVVMLLPAAIDTNWFHETVIPYADWYPLKGRPKFIRWDGKPSPGTPKGGNVIAIYPKVTP